MGQDRHLEPMERLSVIHQLRIWAKTIKRDVLALWLAARDPRVPVAAKAIAGVIAAYALSPVDLIPDFIPILGYLDDLIIVPLGIALAVRLIPPPVMQDLRNRANALALPRSIAGICMVIATWLALALVLYHLLAPAK